MLILVANLGSTSFKYKLLDMSANGAELSRGGYERIGQPGSEYATHGDVIDVILTQLPRQPDAIGFKAVHGGPISGAVKVDDRVIATMEQFIDVAPAHNPPYIAAMKAFREKLPNLPQVAAFETAFHQTIPASRHTYAIPYEWTELGVRRYGFHGASHRYIAHRMKELNPKARRIISCHLGGSSSICAIEDGKSMANSFGMTAQSGIPHNNRTGDFDTFALQKILKQGVSLEDAFRRLGKESGLLGISGVSADMRDIEKAAAEGNQRARLALDVLTESVRHYIGAYLVVLGGCDALVFTGGIGENGIEGRQDICRNLNWAGLVLDDERNRVRGKEAIISRNDSPGEIRIVPTNEEFIVATQAQAVLTGKA